MSEPSAQRFADQARELLDQHARELDAASVARLREARQQALLASGRRHSHYWWLPVGLATAALTLVLVNPLRTPEPVPELYQDPLQQAVVEDLDFLDDMEMMMWLVAEEDAEHAAPNS